MILKQQNQFLLRNADVCEECFLSVTQEPQRALEDIICNSAKTLEKIVRPISRLKSVSRPTTSNYQNTVLPPPKRRSHLNLSLDQDKIDEATRNEKSRVEPSELVKLVAKARPRSGSRNSSETASGTALLPGLLSSKRTYRRESNIEKGSNNQKSSPARIRHLDVNTSNDHQASLLEDKVPSASLSVIKENRVIFPPTRSSSKFLKGSLLIPTERPGSLSRIRTRRPSINSKKSIACKPTKDFDDFLRPSIEDLSTSTMEPKLPTENQSDGQINSQTLRERYFEFLLLIHLKN